MFLNKLRCTHAGAIVLACFCAAPIAAQQGQAGTPAAASPQAAMPPPPSARTPSPNDNLKSLEVLPDHRVTFRIWAPAATDVKLYTEGADATPDITPEELAKVGGARPMQKGEQGVWEVTLGPFEPGAKRYNFIVDGVNTVDPLNPLTSESLTQTRSLYEIPGAPWMEYRPEVPHGAIATVYYNSSATSGLRRMHVYTPPGYEAGSNRLPVLYLLHGGGDSDDSWPTVGRAGAILDNLIAAGKAVPMIVVMPAGHVSREFRLAPGVRMGHDAFNLDLTSVVLPYIDAHYRTVADRDHRALAGLSMGGLQTLTVALTNSADFSSIGVFSSGWFPTTIKEAEDTDAAQYRASGKPFRLFWVGVGKYDIALQNSRASVELLKRAGIQPQVHESGGYHAWNNWRDYLAQFAPMLFTPQSPR